MPHPPDCESSTLREGVLHFKGINRQGRGDTEGQWGFPPEKRDMNCAFCTKNIPIDGRKKIRKKIRVFFKKDLPNARSCDKISLGCKRLVRYKSCRPAICVDAGGCRPAIVETGYFRGVCPILEPGEKITDSDGIRSTGRETASLRNGRNQCSDLICYRCFRENCQAVHRFF